MSFIIIGEYIFIYLNSSNSHLILTLTERYPDGLRRISSVNLKFILVNRSSRVPQSGTKGSLASTCIHWEVLAGLFEIPLKIPSSRFAGFGMTESWQRLRIWGKVTGTTTSEIYRPALRDSKWQLSYGRRYRGFYITSAIAFQKFIYWNLSSPNAERTKMIINNIVNQIIESIEAIRGFKNLQRNL